MKLIRKIFTIATIVSILFACEKNDLITLEIEDKISGDFNIDLSEAKQIGITHFEMENEELLKSGGGQSKFKEKKIKATKTFKKDDVELFHLINYVDGGFIIISADERVTPILAFSETNNFEGENLPGISQWIKEISSGIITAKRELKKPRKKEAKLWDIYNNNADILLKSIDPPGEDCDCDHYFNISISQFVDPISRWCQSGEYS